jgi:hypothetical protein
MPVKTLLLLAVTRMQAGVCIAGLSTEPDPITGLRWVRPVREFGHVLLGDITTAEGNVLQTFDVVAFNLLQPRPQPPHSEDWIADYVHQRPRILRRLEGERRATFLARHLDRDPRQVLRSQERSLCLVKPDWIQGNFRLDRYSGRFDAYLTFDLGGRRYRSSYAKGGLPVTDLKWRALGRAWLPDEGGWVDYEIGDLEARYGIEQVYLALGLTRNYQGRYWCVIIGVHTLPDYQAIIDYDNL